MQYVPQDYANREEDKRRAYQMMKPEKSLMERIEGAILCLRAHFDRELCYAIQDNEYLRFPTFEKYVRSNLHLYHGVFSKDLIEILRDMYTPIPIENI